MRNNIFFFIILPVLVAFTVLATLWGSRQVSLDYPNWWNADRITTVRYHYQTNHDYGLVIKSSEVSQVKAGELFYGEWLIHNPNEDMELRIRNVVWPIGYIKYLNVNDIDGLVTIRKGESVKIQFYGYIDPSVLERHHEQPKTNVVFSNLQIFNIPDFAEKTQISRQEDAEMQQRLTEYSNSPFGGF